MDREVPNSMIDHSTGQTFWSVVGLFVASTIGRVLLSDEPPNYRKFAGEIILSFIGAVILYQFGVLQELSSPEIILFGALSSLGGVRLIEWIIKIAKAAKGMP